MAALESHCSLTRCFVLMAIAYNLIQEWDMNSDQQIEECLRHSDTVYNLVGRNYETK